MPKALDVGGEQLPITSFFAPPKSARPKPRRIQKKADDAAPHTPQKRALPDEHDEDEPPVKRRRSPRKRASEASLGQDRMLEDGDDSSLTTAKKNGKAKKRTVAPRRRTAQPTFLTPPATSGQRSSPIAGPSSSLPQATTPRLRTEAAHVELPTPCTPPRVPKQLKPKPRIEKLVLPAPAAPHSPIGSEPSSPLTPIDDEDDGPVPGPADDPSAHDSPSPNEHGNVWDNTSVLVTPSHTHISAPSTPSQAVIPSSSQITHLSQTWHTPTKLRLISPRSQMTGIFTASKEFPKALDLLSSDAEDDAPAMPSASQGSVVPTSQSQEASQFLRLSPPGKPSKKGRVLDQDDSVFKMPALPVRKSVRAELEEAMEVDDAQEEATPKQTMLDSPERPIVLGTMAQLGAFIPMPVLLLGSRAGPPRVMKDMATSPIKREWVKAASQTIPGSPLARSQPHVATSPIPEDTAGPAWVGSFFQPELYTGSMQFNAETQVQFPREASMKDSVSAAQLQSQLSMAWETSPSAGRGRAVPAFGSLVGLASSMSKTLGKKKSKSSFVGLLTPTKIVGGKSQALSGARSLAPRAAGRSQRVSSQESDDVEVDLEASPSAGRGRRKVDKGKGKAVDNGKGKDRDKVLVRGSSLPSLRLKGKLARRSTVDSETEPESDEEEVAQRRSQSFGRSSSPTPRSRRSSVRAAPGIATQGAGLSIPPDYGLLARSSQTDSDSFPGEESCVRDFLGMDMDGSYPADFHESWKAKK